MKVPVQGSTLDQVSRKDTGMLRLARALLFGIGGFDGNPTLAVLAETLDDELSADRIAKSEARGQ
jgi:hypothetical protein